MRQLLPFLAWALFGLFTVKAELRVPSLFGDHMILQQNSGNTIWGFGRPGEAVKVQASWGTMAETITGRDGRWRVVLDTPGHGTGHHITIEGDNTIRLKDVAIGEVWFCAGQSNMGWSLEQTFGGDEEAASANAPNFRIYRKAREHWHEPLDETRDRLAAWRPCTPASAASASAVSYYFGKTLHDKLEVPVGIIISAYAGTPIEGWIPWELQADDPRARAHKEHYDHVAKRMANKAGMNQRAALARFAKELAAYNDAVDAGDTMKNAFRQRTPPIITKPADLGHQYPAHMYNGMIHPLMPYGIRGMIWYQGERNAKNVPQARHYEQQLPLLIATLRKRWHHESGGQVSDSFPFYFTQLPSWTPPQTVPVEGVESPWPVSREAMRRVADKVPGTGMVVSIDTGDAIGLHPKNKKPIGIRHALLALKQTYGHDIVAAGPRLRGHRADGKRMVLSFDNIGSGLVAAKAGPLDAFAVAGEDRIWHWAEARIDAAKIIVSSAAVEAPVAVRYAWAMNPSRRNLLYNKEGMPASPFRTDTWPLIQRGLEAPEVDKPKKPDGYQPKDWSRPGGY